MFDGFSAIRSRLSAPLRLGFAICVTWLAIEAIVYRSGLYYRIAEPESNAGFVVAMLMVLERQYRPDARNVLVFGDSRVAEGFSAPAAAGEDPRFNFINLAVPGSTARTWYYLLREIDRRDFTFDAIVLAMAYRGIGTVPLADWPLDPVFAAPLVGLLDFWSFPATFESPEMRARARTVVLFPAHASSRDTLALLDDPWLRLRKVREDRPNFVNNLANYPGRNEIMPSLRFTEDGRQVVDWDTATPAYRASVEERLVDRSPKQEPNVIANTQFLARWVGAMAQITGRRGVPLVIYTLPRGPYLPLFAHVTAPPELRKLESEANVVFLPTNLLDGVERPDYFYDEMHTNRAGRERTGAIVGARVRALLTQGTPPQ